MNAKMLLDEWLEDWDRLCYDYRVGDSEESMYHDLSNEEHSRKMLKRELKTDHAKALFDELKESSELFWDSQTFEYLGSEKTARHEKDMNYFYNQLLEYLNNK